MSPEPSQLTEDLVTIDNAGEETSPLETALTPEQRATVFESESVRFAMN